MTPEREELIRRLPLERVRLRGSAHWHFIRLDNRTRRCRPQDHYPEVARPGGGRLGMRRPGELGEQLPRPCVDFPRFACQLGGSAVGS